MKKILLLLCAIGFLGFATAQNADTLMGTYLKADGKSKVQFFKSGDTYSGKIVWLKEPADKNGNPKTDSKGKPLMGMIVITNLKYDKDGTYIDGKCYRPVENDEIKLKLKLLPDGILEVTGSKWGFSKTEKWKKQM